MNRFLVAIIICLSFFILISNVSASFLIGNNSVISKSYNAGDIISGSLNISLTNQDSSSLITDNYGHSISLYNFLKKTSINYSCSTKGCLDDYTTADSGSTSDQVNLNSDKIFGVKINDANVNINDFSFNVQSDVGASCNQQLTLDILDDQKIDWGNQLFTSDICGGDVKSSCNSGNFNQWVLLSPQTYCEKITLPQAPAFDVKAYIMQDQNAAPVFSQGLLQAFIYDSNRELVGNCNLTQPSTSGGFVSCTINYVNTQQQDAEICIATKDIESSGYKLQASSNTPYCGFLGDPTATNSFVKDYNIVVNSKKFNSIGNFQINETNFEMQNGNSLVNYINNYISNKYNSDCSNNCYIPIKLSGTLQNIVISNLNFNYNSAGSTGSQSNLIYNMQKAASKMSVQGYKNIDLSLLNFSVNQGNKTYILFLNGQEISRQNISVIPRGFNFIRAVYPLNVAVANPTTFSVFTDPNFKDSNVSYSWDFGEGKVVSSNSNQVSYTYSSIGNYTLKISAIENGNVLTTNLFTISAQSPKNAINTTLINYYSYLTKIQSQISSLPQQYQTVINQKVDINSIKSQLDAIKISYNSKVSDNGTTDDQYISLMTELISIKVPVDIQYSVSSNLNFIDQVDLINVANINDLFGDNYNPAKVSDYQNSIASWSLSNVDTTLNYKVLSIIYSDSKDDVLSEFQFKVNPKNTVNYPVYLVIETDSDKMILENGSTAIRKQGLTGMQFDLSNGAQTKTFAVIGNVGVFDIPSYISPQLSQISFGNTVPTTPKNFWTYFLPGIIILLILAFIVYIAIQEWYKKHYESHLFKDKNQLYNLIYFISNAKRQGLNDEQIKTKLKKERWSGEQVTYAIRKFEGKRVGLWEIPIFSWREKKILRQELEKRNSRQVVY